MKIYYHKENPDMALVEYYVIPELKYAVFHYESGWKKWKHWGDEDPDWFFKRLYEEVGYDHFVNNGEAADFLTIKEIARLKLDTL